MKRIGSRAEVFHNTAKQTSGGLLKKDLIKVKGRIKSKRVSFEMRKSHKNPLAKLKLLVPKGSSKFGADLANRNNNKYKTNTKKNKNTKNKTNKFFFGLFS